MTENIEDSPFIKMRKQFLKEKDAIVKRYEDEIRELQERIRELENQDIDDTVDVLPDDFDEPFFDVEEK